MTAEWHCSRIKNLRRERIRQKVMNTSIQKRWLWPAMYELNITRYYMRKIITIGIFWLFRNSTYISNQTVQWSLTEVWPWFNTGHRKQKYFVIPGVCTATSAETKILMDICIYKNSPRDDWKFLSNITTECTSCMLNRISGETGVLNTRQNRE